MDPFRRYSRSKSKVVRNRAKFWTIFGPPKLLGAGLPKIVLSLSFLARGTSTEKKFCEDTTPNSPEVIEPNTLNFRPNYKFSGLKFVGGPPSQFRCALARFGQSVACVKFSGRSTPYGPKYSIPKKCVLLGSYSHLSLCN